MQDFKNAHDILKELEDGKNWNGYDFQENYYCYLERVAEADALFPLTDFKPQTEDIKKLQDFATYNLKLILDTSSIPFLTAFSAGMMSQQLLVEKILRQAISGDKESIVVANYLKKIKHYTLGVDAILPTFQTFNKHHLMTDQFNTFHKLIISRFYGCLEEFCKYLLKSICLNKLDVLLELHSKNLKIGKSNFNTLYSRIIQAQRDDSLSLEDAYTEKVFNKGFQFVNFNKLFESIFDIPISPEIVENLKLLESMRHIIIHRHSIIDKKFLDETNYPAKLGDSLYLSPQTLYGFEKSLIQYLATLLGLGDSYLLEISKG